MAQHVRMNLKWELRGSPGPLDYSQEPRRGNWRASLSHEHIRPAALQRPQCPKFRAMQGMHALDPAFGSIDVQATMPQINLRPFQRAEFGSAQAMPVR
jgi:hypothetical protein